LTKALRHACRRAILFLGFYIAALLNRRRPDWHKRFMITAAATVITAATWRLIASFADVFGWMH
jgi:hypothetical protein